MRRRTKIVLGTLAALAAVVAALNLVVVRGGGAEHRIEGVADCALVLGARVYADGTPSQVLQDRLDESYDLYRAGRVRRIVVSGDHGKESYDETNAMRTYLEKRGVPPEDIFMDHAGFDTYSSVWRAKHVFGARKVVIVTQRFHLARAVWVARSMGMEAEGAPSDRRMYRGIAWLHCREVVSRTKAFVDVTVDRTPRHSGPKIPLDGDATATRG